MGELDSIWMIPRSGCILFKKIQNKQKKNSKESKSFTFFASVAYLYWGLPWLVAAAAAKSLQSCLTLCDHIDGSPPGSPIPGILQARILEWVAISFSNAWKWKVKVKSLSRVRLLATPRTAAHQVPPSMGFSRQGTGVWCHCLLRPWLVILWKLH